MCSIAIYLRHAFYASTLSFRPAFDGERLSAGDRALLVMERDQVEYQAALSAYQQHFQSCLVCQQETATPEGVR